MSCLNHASLPTGIVTGRMMTPKARLLQPCIAPVTAPAVIEHVAYGCGPGWHPNPWGRCVPYRRVIYPGYYYWGGPRVYIGPVWHPYHRWHHWRRW